MACYKIIKPSNNKLLSKQTNKEELFVKLITEIIDVVDYIKYKAPGFLDDEVNNLERYSLNLLELIDENIPICKGCKCSLLSWSELR